MNFFKVGQAVTHTNPENQLVTTGKVLASEADDDGNPANVAFADDGGVVSWRPYSEVQAVE